MWGLLHYGNPDLYRYDAYSGVSAGSVNIGAMSVWPKGSEVEMSEYLADLSQTSTRKLVEKWPGGIA